ncbi:MAG TPA: YbaB/EbfC family nucleoid-associated protein [Candidatus Dormibacteraeota bacterium]|nr:YbaB/EbfC family nucleoid-associated protein [Candidatus Dormibacteraeota bacterium]
MNQAQLMRMLQKTQAEMARVQEELATTAVTGSAGGGAVKVEMTADMKVTKVTIDREAVDPEDVESLEDAVLAAVNAAMASAQELSSRKMGAVTGGMRIPGLF